MNLVKDIQDPIVIKNILKNHEKNRFGIISRCPFYPVADIFALFPPDPMHDVIEGVINRMMVQYFLPYCTNLTNTEVANKIESFKFFHGNILMKYDERRKKFFLSGAKAINVSKCIIV